jgi:hypothetical protein
MIAQITAVSAVRGHLREFDFTHVNGEGKLFEGAISLDEAIGFANRPDLGPVAEMCRMIKATPPGEFSWLVGRIFTNDS